MRPKSNRSLAIVRVAAVAAGTLLCGSSFGVQAGGAKNLPPPLVLQEIGSRAFGGTQIGDPKTSSLSCDHGYVEWETPINSYKLPILMWHSAASKTWETPTPNGGEGFNTMFLRRGHPVYIIDGSPSGRAGQACNPYSYTPSVGRDQSGYNSYRLGIWLPPAPPQPYPHSQEPVNNPAGLDQMRRANYPEDQSPTNVQLQSDEVSALLKDIGPTILFTHSGSAVRGWWTRIKNNNVRAIVAFEPGAYVFPQGEVPGPIQRADGVLVPVDAPLSSTISKSDFAKLTKIPILIMIGDNIPKKLDPANTGPLLTLDSQRINFIRGQIFAQAINRHGGDATIYVLPDHGIFGNGHFIMWGRNNATIADIVTNFLKSRGFESHEYAQH